MVISLAYDPAARFNAVRHGDVGPWLGLTLAVVLSTLAVAGIESVLELAGYPRDPWLPGGAWLLLVSLVLVRQELRLRDAYRPRWTSQRLSDLLLRCNGWALGSLAGLAAADAIASNAGPALIGSPLASLVLPVAWSCALLLALSIGGLVNALEPALARGVIAGRVTRRAAAEMLALAAVGLPWLAVFALIAQWLADPLAPIADAAPGAWVIASRTASALAAGWSVYALVRWALAGPSKVGWVCSVSASAGLSIRFEHQVVSNDLPGRWIVFGRPLAGRADAELIARLERGSPDDRAFILVAPAGGESGVQFGGDHLMLSDRIGRLKSLWPQREAEIGDWLRTVPPPGRGRGLRRRELYPADALLVAALRRLAAPADEVVLVARDEAEVQRWQGQFDGEAQVRVLWSPSPSKAPPADRIAGYPTVNIETPSMLWFLAPDRLVHISAHGEFEPPEQYPPVDPQTLALPPSAPNTQASAGAQVFTAIAASADGRWVAGGCTDGRVIVLDAATLAQVHVLPGPEARVTALAFSMDGQWLASASAGSIRVAQLEPGSASLVLSNRAGVSSLVFAADGALLSALADHSLQLWQISSGRAGWHFQGWKQSIADAAMSADGRVIAAAADRVRFCFLNTSLPGSETWEEVSEFAGVATALALSPDGQTLAIGGARGEVGLWDVVERSYRELASGLDRIRRLSFSFDCQSLSATGGSHASVWIALTSDPFTIRGPESSTEIAFAAERHRVFVAVGGLAVTAMELKPKPRRPRVFISYEREYQPYVELLVRSLQPDVEVLWDREFQVGEHWPSRLNEMLESSDAMIAVVGSATERRPYPMREIDSAVRAGKPLLPVFVDRFDELPELMAANLDASGGIAYLNDLQGQALEEAVSQTANRIRQTLLPRSR